MKNETNNMQLYNDILDKLLIILNNLEKYNDLSNKILLTTSQEYSIDEKNPAIYDRIKSTSEKVNNISNYYCLKNNMKINNEDFIFYTKESNKNLFNVEDHIYSETKNLINNFIINITLEIIDEKLYNISNYLKSTIIPSIKIINLENKNDNV